MKCGSVEVFLSTYTQELYFHPAKFGWIIFLEFLTFVLGPKRICTAFHICKLQFKLPLQTCSSSFIMSSGSYGRAGSLYKRLLHAFHFRIECFEYMLESLKVYLCFLMFDLNAD